MEDIEPPSQNSGGNAFLQKLNSILIKLITLARAQLKRAIFWLSKISHFSKTVMKQYRVNSPKLLKYRKNSPHIIILTLTLIVMFSNIIVRSAKADLSLNIADPGDEIAISSSLDKFTSLIPEDGKAVEDAYFASSEEYSDIGGPITTNITEREEPLPDNSTETVYYTVKDGDTLTGLGWKFGVKIDTLRYLNKLSNVDMIKPAQKLKIPPEGYEVAAKTIVAWEKSLTAKKYASSSSSSVSTKSLSNYSGYYSYDIGVPISSIGVSRGYTWYHRGIDYRANNGTAVYAATSGRVASAGWNNSGYGKQIILSHSDGRSTRYAHLSGYAISRGAYVKRGQLIGYSGNTGRSTGPHLHFELMISGRPVSPFK